MDVETITRLEALRCAIGTPETTEKTTERVVQRAEAYYQFLSGQKTAS